MSTFVRRLLGLLSITALFVGLGLGSTTGSHAAAAEAYPKQGQTSVRVLDLQSRLLKAKLLAKAHVTGHYGARTTSAVKAYQKKVALPQTGKVTAATWKKLVAATGKEDLSSVPGVDKRCKKSGRVICVDKTRDKLFFLVDSSVVQVLDARFGCAGMRTREGQFTVLRKSRHHVSSIYHTPMPWAMFFSGGQAVHYSSDFAKRGYAGCSHGCVNTRDKAGIARLYDQVKVGDRVVVYKS